MYPAEKMLDHLAVALNVTQRSKKRARIGLLMHYVEATRCEDGVHGASVQPATQPPSEQLYNVQHRSAATATASQAATCTTCTQEAASQLQEGRLAGGCRAAGRSEPRGASGCRLQQAAAGWLRAAHWSAQPATRDAAVTEATSHPHLSS